MSKIQEKKYFHFYFWKNVLLFGSNAIERFLSFGVLIRLQKKKFDYLEQIFPKRGMKMRLILGGQKLATIRVDFGQFNMCGML